MAHHAQMSEARPLDAQKWRDVQTGRPSRHVRPPRKKFTAPAGQTPMGGLLHQKGLQGLTSLQMRAGGSLPLQATPLDAATGQ
jgi:hypothetical protein